jgi:hypothetical protein
MTLKMSIFKTEQKRKANKIPFSVTFFTMVYFLLSMKFIPMKADNNFFLMSYNVTIQK